MEPFTAWSDRSVPGRSRSGDRYNTIMSDVTRLLLAIDTGDESASDELLPLVYQELRKLAASRLANAPPGQSLQPTVLVHEAYLRLVKPDQPQHWDGRGHFFGAAAEAMRRILVDNARKKQSQRHGGQMRRVDLDLANAASENPGEELLALDEALSRLEKKWPEKAMLVKLRYFAGLTIPEASQALRISTATAERHWRFARAWLRNQLEQEAE